MGGGKKRRAAGTAAAVLNRSLDRDALWTAMPFPSGRGVTSEFSGKTPAMGPRSKRAGMLHRMTRRLFPSKAARCLPRCRSQRRYTSDHLCGRQPVRWSAGRVDLAHVAFEIDLHGRATPGLVPVWRRQKGTGQRPTGAGCFRTWLRRAGHLSPPALFPGELRAAESGQRTGGPERTPFHWVEQTLQATEEVIELTGYETTIGCLSFAPRGDAAELPEVETSSGTDAGHAKQDHEDKRSPRGLRTFPTTSLAGTTVVTCRRAKYLLIDLDDETFCSPTSG